jgi:hypothetical protein
MEKVTGLYQQWVRPWKPGESKVISQGKEYQVENWVIVRSLELGITVAEYLRKY